MPVLETRNLTKRFGATEVLSGINLKVEKGEFLVLVGPSGCGKSTLLNMIAGLEDITEGEILINDRLVNDLPPKDRDIAMVFQSYALYPTMSVARNITYGMRMRGIPARERREAMHRVAAQLQIDHLLDRKPSQLSGGQRQRVAMGRALVREPEIFLFDEPLSNLDAKLRVEMRAEIKRLHSRLNATIVYVTHDQTEAMSLATQVAVLNEGAVAQFGAPQELYDHPVSVFVADFIGSPSMNMLEGVLRKSGGRLVFSPGGDYDSFNLPVGHYAFRNGYSPEHRVLLGIRPEYITDRLEAREAHVEKLELVPMLIETNGFDQHVTFSFLGTEIGGRFSPRQKIIPGKAIPVMLDLSAISLFDAGTGKRL